MEQQKMRSLQECKDVLHLCASSCLNCTMCYPVFEPNCPSLEQFGFMSYSSKGRSGLIYGYITGNQELTPKMSEVMYSCNLCKACTVGCQQDWKDYIVEGFEAMREEVVNKGTVPPVPAQVRDFLTAVQTHGNPYKLAGEERGKWAEGLDVNKYNGEDYLLYIGCEGSYDPKGQDMARALIELLSKAEVSFGILGNDEKCDGNEVNRLGERGLYEMLAEENIKQFKELGVKKVITLSPHAYHTMKNEYPLYGADFEVIHYTQLLQQLIDDKKIDAAKANLGSVKVVYHDSCFLGRYNEDYDSPREVLESINGLELVEMPRNKESSFCCGGGGGNFITDLLGSGPNSANRIRTREAMSTEAEILAVSCPICASMFEDAVKSEGMEGKLKVKDVAQILNEAL